MKTKRVTWSCQHDCAPGEYNTVVCHDPVAIVLMTEDLPLVQIFDGEGNRTDCGQYRTLAEVSESLAKSLNGEKLTMCGRKMPNETELSRAAESELG
jgi:hypothetical protein